MTTGREANVNSLRPSVCNFSEFPCPSNRGRFNPLRASNPRRLRVGLLSEESLCLSENHYYSLVTLNDHLFAAGFAGMRAALLARKSPAGREIKVVVASPSEVSDSAVIKFAKTLTKHIRGSRGLSAGSAGGQSMGN